MKAFNNISRALLESNLAVGLFAGLLLALAIFFSALPQLPVNSPNVLLPGSTKNGVAESPVEEKSDHVPPANRTAGSPAATKQAHEQEPTNSPRNFTGEAIAPTSVLPPLKPICDLSDQRYDGCEMWGDARTVSGTNRSRVYFIPPPAQLTAAKTETWRIRSQSRKMIGVREVLVMSLNLSNLHEAPNCTVRRSVPAVVFALGGLTFNYWHAFSDVLVPLFTTARAFGGEVELVATDVPAWYPFLSKYSRVLRALSRYDVVELDSDREVRCYAHLVVGLRGHRDFDIDPARAPNHYDMFAFRVFIREAYALPPQTAALPCKTPGTGGARTTKPRLMIILRGGTRRFVNADAVVGAIERAGFDVVRMEPTSAAADMDAVSREVDACDVLVGAHGAGLTNMVFLRTGGVVVQVIPWGKMEPYSEGFFGAPAAHMGIRHVTYSIAAEESTLYDTYGKDHPVITDPDVFYKNGSNARYYWREQNVRLNTTRFMPTLDMVKRLLQE